jgi:hypothetical protein
MVYEIQLQLKDKMKQQALVLQVLQVQGAWRVLSLSG